jgi:hypothetical protein
MFDALTLKQEEERKKKKKKRLFPKKPPILRDGTLTGDEPWLRSEPWRGSTQDLPRDPVPNEASMASGLPKSTLGTPPKSGVTPEALSSLSSPRDPLTTPEQKDTIETPYKSSQSSLFSRSPATGTSGLGPVNRGQQYGGDPEEEERRRREEEERRRRRGMQQSYEGI